MAQDKVCLGAIVGVHGIKGEVKIKCFCSDEKHLTAYGALSNEQGDKTFTIRVVGHAKDLLRAKIDGVTDRTQAETYVGIGLYVAKDKLPSLQEEEFYHADLIDLRADNTTGETIGVVNAIYNFGAGDILELKMLDGTLDMLPFNRSFVPVVNIKDGYIIVEMPTYQPQGDDA